MGLFDKFTKDFAIKDKPFVFPILMLILLGASCCLVGMCLWNSSQEYGNFPVDYIIRGAPVSGSDIQYIPYEGNISNFDNKNFSIPFCHLISQFDLISFGGNRKIVSVCDLNNLTVVDIREFNYIGIPTNVGIRLYEHEWKFLCKLMFDITLEVVKYSIENE